MRTKSLCQRSRGHFMAITLLLLAGCSPAKQYLQADTSLSKAGFVSHYSDTTARYAMMNLLPPGRMTFRLAPDGSKIYLYSDPIGCGCVYMGDQSSYETYRSRNPGIPTLDDMAAEIRRDTTAWDWSAWTPSADPGSNQPKHMIGAYW
ncbi:hypothetical protein AA14337_3328 [Acetobacter malorum DSM 14337]|uniref:Lipoprotein n=3 Tax=Acetobacter TaxID=434 RepID=A0A1U9LIT1_9PROT|nr:hypothetical protein [Acetobacter persici]AQT06332.1 hypothetical protein A0U91_15030 [Acetobacter persici]KXV06478.1 hypothetical protein AD930_07690 [Acetobacter malorum]GBQ86465.1 hypothetical protein AA14337_3328 [Acetobacter malorum DSM 14337]